jgi:CRP-like cAMP-binding protein
MSSYGCDHISPSALRNLFRAFRRGFESDRRAACRREVPAGTNLFHQDETRLGATAIAEGRVEILRDNGDGPEPVVILGPGDVLGEQTFLAIGNKRATEAAKEAFGPFS